MARLYFQLLNIGKIMHHVWYPSMVFTFPEDIHNYSSRIVIDYAINQIHYIWKSNFIVIGSNGDSNLIL